VEYFVHLAILICLYAILAQAFNLIFGLGGLFNLAHVASFALGAYATGLASTELGSGFVVCVVLSVLVSALFSLLLGAIALRLYHDYFAIGTLAFASVVSALLINWKSLTRGVLGISGIPRPEIFGISFDENLNFLALIFCCAILSNLLLYFLFRSPFGRLLKAQAESLHACLALGRDVRAVKVASFAVASGFAGLAGTFFAYYLSYIDPSSFALREMIFVLTIAIVGKPGSFWGCLAATIFLVLLPEPLRFLDIPAHILGPMRQMIYALILFLVILLRRDSLFPAQRTI
jgi:ABC-type branched-subunit amino acid transport system permease subunit